MNGNSLHRASRVSRIMTLGVLAVSSAGAPLFAQQPERAERSEQARQDRQSVQGQRGAEAARSEQPTQTAQPVRRVAVAAASQPPLGTPRPGEPRVIGEGELSGPETALWDEAADVYLVSNVNGELTVTDDNGFISRLSPSGEIIELRWIDGADPDVVLHAPKGMLLVEDRLYVADLGAVRVFDRSTGAAIRGFVASESHMLNALTRTSDGTIYVTDTGGDRNDPPGAVYAVDEDGAAAVVARGEYLDRPNGIVADGDSLLVASFASNASQVYRLNRSGERTDYATLPGMQLDGLYRLPDGSLLVTSWRSNAVYRLQGRQAEILVDGADTPAQIGYDASRDQLLLPVPLANRMLIYPILWE